MRSHKTVPLPGDWPRPSGETAEAKAKALPRSSEGGGKRKSWMDLCWFLRFGFSSSWMWCHDVCEVAMNECGSWLCCNGKTVVIDA